MDLLQIERIKYQIKKIFERLKCLEECCKEDIEAPPQIQIVYRSLDSMRVQGSSFMYTMQTREEIYSVKIGEYQLTSGVEVFTEDVDAEIQIIKVHETKYVINIFSNFALEGRHIKITKNK